MQNYGNNAFFWQKIDSIYLSSKFNIAYEKGQAHINFPNLIYPVQYGYLSDLVDEKDLGIAVFKGSANTAKVESLIIAADILKKDIEPKIIVSCTEEEVENILHFLNQTDLQKSIIMKRGIEQPSWAMTH